MKYDESLITGASFGTPLSPSKPQVMVLRCFKHLISPGLSGFVLPSNTSEFCVGSTHRPEIDHIVIRCYTMFYDVIQVTGTIAHAPPNFQELVEANICRKTICIFGVSPWFPVSIFPSLHLKPRICIYI